MTINSEANFSDYEVYREKLEEFKKFQAQISLSCCLCDKKFTGNFKIMDPYPLKDSGACCTECYTHKVVPARLRLAAIVKNQYSSFRKNNSMEEK